ncbi:MAG: tetratricopeptide repeat-containing sensor histidine kinase [Spirosomataceae bacterium]
MEKCLFFWVFIVFNGFSQSKIDSLQKELKKNQHDTIQLKIYTELIKTSIYANPDLAKLYAAKFDSTATLLKSELDIALGKNYLGMVNYANNDINLAIKYYLEAIKRFEKLNKTLRVGIALNNIGACYQYKGESQQAINYYKKALQIFMTEKDNQWIANVSHNLSNEYFKEAEKATKTKQQIEALNEAERFEKIARSKFEELKDTYSVGLSFINFGNIYFKRKDFVKALDNYKKAEKLIDKSYDPISYGIIIENIGNTLIEQKKYQEAIPNLMRASQIFRETKAIPNLKSTLKNLKSAYEGAENYKGALAVQNEFIAISDSLFSIEKDKIMLDALKKYESEKKDQENRLLTQKLTQEKQQKTAYGIGLLSLILFSGIIGYFLVKNRQKNQLIGNQNQKLSELNKEKNYLISMVSHDLNTPFLAIKTWNNILKMTLGDNTKAIEAAQIIDTSANQGIALIRNILDIEKREINRQELQLNPLDLVHLTQEVIKEFLTLAATKGIEVVFESNQQKISMLSDKYLVIRVLENLLSNAIKYSYPHQKIRIRVDEFPQKIQLKVKDEGVGIAPQDIPKLFTKYGVTTSKPTDNESSIGLGLNIVKRILDETGGEIQCQSELGKGTEFTVNWKK